MESKVGNRNRKFSTSGSRQRPVARVGSGLEQKLGCVESQRARVSSRWEQELLYFRMRTAAWGPQK